MKRREFLRLIGATGFSWPCTAAAQRIDQPRRIGVLMSIAEDDPEGRVRAAALQEGLQLAGWSVGRNLLLEWRWAAGDRDRMQRYADELVAMRAEAIVANSPQVTAELRKATRDIPIIFVQVADPVGSGFVASLAKPGGNVTGLASFEPQLAGKWLEILRDLAPRVTRVLTILDPEFAGYVALSQMIEAVAPRLGIVPIIARVRNSVEIREAMQKFAQEPDGGGLIVLPAPITAVERGLIIALAAEHRLPAVYPYKYFASSGGLLAYGIDPLDLYFRAGSYVDRILKGEKPSNLPVQHPTRFDLVINLRTAKELGLAVPRSLLASATQLIDD
jgi:putative tryptophan/tyrosine transport system substrate-binding protein